MISNNKARELAQSKLEDLEAASSVELSIMDCETIEFKFGWMFFYQSKNFVMTGNDKFLVGGNAPIIVDKYNSSVHMTGTRRGERFYIENYSKYRDDLEKFYDMI